MKKRMAMTLLVLCALANLGMAADDLEKGFAAPPDSAKPWTYWFWINGNITREGITADLEAMARVGIHGVLIMEVAQPKQMAPTGPVAFGSPVWRELFRHAVAEAGRLGMEINMNNDAGWTGSGGPWNTPEFSMQKLVSTSLAVQGPRRCEETLAAPVAVQGYYRDLKVLAYPASAAPQAKPPVLPKAKKQSAKKAALAPVPVSADPIPADRILDLTSKMNPAGKLDWDVPVGHWIIQRIGHTSTGQMNKPSPEAGRGLECDKFSAEALQRHFEAFIGKLVDDLGATAARTLTLTHIDSWEVAGQNWTPRMAQEFSRRRGYDLTPWLVSLAGGPPLGSVELTRRFQRDFKRTQSELMTENYAAALRALANRRGLQLSIEAYGPNGEFINPLDYGAEADLPMAEFWVARWGAWHLQSSRFVSSAAHAAGKAIVGAESFTALGENDAWTEHPYSIKTVGDWAFSEGVNRFIFHRTVLQPWAGLEPGMSFGPFGTHFDRNQTWWEPGAAFMKYLARCQYLLQQGWFVADVCRLVPDGENHGSKPGMAALPGRYAALPGGYNYDYLSDKTLVNTASVVNGRITLPSGMSYRVMQLPEATTMTPELLRKLRDLVRAGAIVIGPKPEKSPSLQGYPNCDTDVHSLAAELWGGCDGRTVTEHVLGAGRVFWGEPMAEVLRAAASGPDVQVVVDPPVNDDAIRSVTLGRGKTMGDEPPGLMPSKGLNWIHRRAGETEIYFLANPQHRPVEAQCSFRVSGRQPELWNPETGEMSKPAVFSARDGRTHLPIRFTPAGSAFVVFRAPADPALQVVRVRRDGAELLGGGTAAAGGLLPGFWRRDRGVQLETMVSGRYEVEFADGQTRTTNVPAPQPPVTVGGPWQVRFQSARGAPVAMEFQSLVDWAQHENDGIRFFSGTASYATAFDWQPEAGGRESGRTTQSRYVLDLGRVEVMAEVRLNGADLGVLWKPPFTVEVTDSLRAGRNRLEVKVTNLWPNRLIGDERFPDDCTAGGTWKTGPIPAWPEWFLKGQLRPEPRRLTFTTWKYYTADSPRLPSGLLGPVMLQMARVLELRNSL
jgi:hypothetical protein